MSAAGVLAEVAAVGGELWLKPGGMIGYRIPPEAASILVPLLRRNKAEVMALLAGAAPMPPGLALVHWSLIEPPVPLDVCTTVVDPELFARAEIALLGAKLRNPCAWTGWTVGEHMARLRAVGVVVEVIQ